MNVAISSIRKPDFYRYWFLNTIPNTRFGAVPSISFNLLDRVGIFIDRENIENVVGHGRVDYPTLVRTLAQGRNIGIVAVYDMLLPNDLIQASVHSKLRRAGFNVITPRGHCSKKGKQMGVDVNMAIDIIDRVAEGNFDVIIIVSGDGDFTPVVDNVKRKCKKVEVASFEEAVNKSLIDEVDRFIPLDSLPILIPEESL